MEFKGRKKRFFFFVKNVDPIRLVKKPPHKLKRNNKNCKNEKKTFANFFIFPFSFISCELKQSSVRGRGKGVYLMTLTI